MDIRSNSRVNFGRAFTTKERIEAEQAQKEAKKLLGTDKIILITPDTSLPAGKNDIGVGQLNSKSSEDFYKFMQSYAGINQVKLLPQGELTKNPDGLHCAYSGSSLTLGTHTVNLEELTKPEMGSILSQETFENVKKGTTSTTDANFENVVGTNSPHRQAMKEAFDNFKKSDAPELAKMKEEFETYKVNHEGTVENRALFEILQNENNGELDFKKWPNEIDRELFNEDVITKERRTARIKELKDSHPEDIEFTYFRQFMADKNLEKAKKNLNDKGMKLYGDCLIGFSKDEVWSHPKAFEKDAYIGNPDWKIHALDYSKINDKNSESFKLLKQKVAGFAERYDNIRFDVGWSYAKPLVFTQNPDSLKDRYHIDQNIENNKPKTEKAIAFRPNNDLKGELLDKIEEVVKEVKGKDYDVKNLIYETEAGPSEFTAYQWEGENKVIDPFKNRKIVQSTVYMDDGYATVDMLENKMKIPREDYVYMVGNHDHLSLKALSNKVDTDGILKEGGNNIEEVVNRQYKPLARELKVTEDSVKAPKDFVKAKFGHSFLAKNVKMFFMDVFGSDRQFDSQKANSGKNYRQRVPANFEEAYHTAVQNNDGLNLYDALGKALKAEGFDKSHPKIYETINKFGKLLSEEGVKTEEEANNKFSKEITEAKAKTPVETAKKMGKKTKYTLGAIAGLGIAAGAVKINQYYNKKVENYKR